MPESQAIPPRQPVTLRPRTLLRILATAAFVMLLAECLRIFVGSNFFAVVPGKCYRSAQPTAKSLASAQRAYGIRTIINLRDENPDDAWYQEEEKAAKRLGVTLVNAGLSTSEQAPAEDFSKFVQAMKAAQEPVLIHCANGNDRSGLASAFYLLMRTNTSIAETRRQLSMRYGHNPWSKASCLSRTLDSYEAWLQVNSWGHNADRLFHWGTQVYRPEKIEQ